MKNIIQKKQIKIKKPQSNCNKIKLIYKMNFGWKNYKLKKIIKENQIQKLKNTKSKLMN